MSKVKIGVIGCGSIGTKRHLTEYAANPNVEIVAVCDKYEARANAAAEKFGGTPYTDYYDLLKHEGLDGVSVCTPNYLHAAISIAALEAGKHVLCEKPMATSHEEAKAMIAAAEKTGKFLMIGHNQRLMAPHVKAKEILDSGVLGRVLTFRTAFGHGGPEQWSVEGPGGWFFQKQQAFVGTMGDLGVHKADLLRYLLAEEINEVGAFVSTLEKQNTDVDDNAVLILKTESGKIGTLAASWTYKPKEDNSTTFYCEKGTLRLVENPDYGVIVDFANGERALYQVGQVATNDKQISSRIPETFISHIITNTQPSISGEEGYKSLKVILAALESAATGQIVKVE
jgi:predicted dehydrogenase